MKPGAVVVVDFVGAIETKRRPAVVVSTESYHKERPDLILALITSQTDKATSSTDHVLSEWKTAGLNKPSVVRMYIQTYPAARCRTIGHLYETDWVKVKELVRSAVSV